MAPTRDVSTFILLRYKRCVPSSKTGPQKVNWTWYRSFLVGGPRWKDEIWEIGGKCILLLIFHFHPTEKVRDILHIHIAPRGPPSVTSCILNILLIRNNNREKAYSVYFALKSDPRGLSFLSQLFSYSKLRLARLSIKMCVVIVTELEDVYFLR